MSENDLPSRNAKNFFKQLIKRVDRLEAEGDYNQNEIAAYILAELHREGMTLQQFEDWKNGYWSG